MYINSNLAVDSNHLVGNINHQDAYELDMDVSFNQFGGKVDQDLITSKSLCTPGCGKTGTGNSFCC